MAKLEKASGNNLTSSASNNRCTTSQSSTVQRTKGDVTPLSAIGRLSTVRPGVTSSTVASSLSVKCNRSPSTVELPTSMPLKRMPAIGGVRSGQRQSAVTAPTPIPTSSCRLEPTTITIPPAASDPNVPKLLSRRSGSLPVLQVPSITPPLQSLRLSTASFSSSIASTAQAKSIVKPTVPEGKKSLMSHLGLNMSRLQAQQSTPKTAPKVSTGSLFAGYGRTSLLDNRIPLLSLSNTPKSASLLGSGLLYNNRLSSALPTGLTVARSAPQLGKRSLPLTLAEADNFDAKRARVAFSNCSANVGRKIALTTFKGATVSPALSVDTDTLSSAPSTPAATGHSQSSVHSQSSLDSDMLGSDDLSSVLDEVSCWLKDAVVPESRGQTLDHLPALSCSGDGWENWLMDDLL